MGFRKHTEEEMYPVCDQSGVHPTSNGFSNKQMSLKYHNRRHFEERTSVRSYPKVP